MTAPQIGNYGINEEDEESDGPKFPALWYGNSALL